MKKIYVAFFILLSVDVFGSGESAYYRFTINLKNPSNDQVGVELTVPPLAELTINYCLPKIVPGTYSIYDFGRFIEGFAAYDAAGNTLPISSKDENIWIISDAQRLHHISYRVNDSYDAWDKSNAIFEPAGSNIEIDSNYVINTFAFIGYFEGKEFMPYELTILHPEKFYGGTAMVDHASEPGVDIFRSPSYHDIADNPLMYCAPDTATVQVGNCRVLFTIYSPNKKSARKISCQ